MRRTFHHKGEIVVEFTREFLYAAVAFYEERVGKETFPLEDAINYFLSNGSKEDFNGIVGKVVKGDLECECCKEKMGEVLVFRGGKGEGTTFH